MTYHVVLSSQAERELRQIATWICERSPAGAARWLEAFDKAERAEAVHTALFLVTGDAPAAAGGEVRIVHIRGPGQAPLEDRELK